MVNDDVVMKLRPAGALSKRKCILAIDTHDITYYIYNMYYGDPDAEGVVGTQPRKGSHWEYKFGSTSVLAGGERLTLAAVPDMHGESSVEHVRMLIEHNTCIHAYTHTRARTDAHRRTQTHPLSLGVRPKILIRYDAYNSVEVIKLPEQYSSSMKYIISIAAQIDGIRHGWGGGAIPIYRTGCHRRKMRKMRRKMSRPRSG